MTFSQRLGPSFFRSTQDRVRALAVESGLDAVLTDDPEDVAYLTGFFHHPCERPVAVWLDTDGRCLLLLPELEREHAEAQHAAADLVSYPEYPGVVPPFAALGRVLGPGRRRAGHTTSITHQRLTAAASALSDVELVATELVTRCRYVKDPDEVVLHAEAARITDVMLTEGVRLVTDALATGGELPSEAELAAHVTRVGTGTMYAEHTDVVVVSMLAGGLVYAGPNSAYPHGLPSGYRLRPGDTFMLSLGCAVGGRFVEGERTFVLGEPTAEQRHFHEAVRLAQQVGGEAIRPGAECRAANAACLAVIRDAGLGGYLRHRQGHGIGLGMHEPPWLEDGDDTVLEPGMIVSNEPGVYVPGHAGYRISDSMLVTETGSRPLTSFPRSIEDCVIPV
ncbi:M24 family metallopeptidase [Actinophytocola gossypii]|uniref:Aminopeptidase P family protein n=1 Tax=Actinophytocola gossypii TaxID=2812003 RepID=A0ABT2J6M9_9PSEU|nr:Xaa-Pro peptidase family protein [Actinophytocola gossypii]MCT2583443.1 aminopeptidase P family protein [Actinophytocola gossypii]